ncbi:MAG: outer membrane protein assembly factor BamE, partial [Kiritimatiellales bacterium]|nr:outer membrane protein assembly factor BamE [Kiritimatiellales bacterium]
MKLKIETRIKTLATIRSVVLVCLVFAAGSVLAETQIQVGDTRQEVLRLMGTPVGEGAVGKRELLNYARGDAVVLENGKVVEIRMDGEIITADSIARNEAMESQSAASLGKTKAFCRRKYGEALKSSSTGSMEITMYVHDGWLIKIVFLADIAHRIDYHILEPESSSNILDEEFLAMLDRQADG